MAQRTLISSLPRGLLRPCAFCIQHPRLACLLLICVILLLNALSAFAQTSQSVYASVPVTATGATTTTSQVVSFTKSAAAALSLVGAPVPSTLEGGPMAIDSQGLFLFVLNPTSGLISMYQINQAPGLTEVPGSPFAASTGGVGLDSGVPVCIATEKTGHFLYVGFNPANPNANGEIIEYAIVAAAQQIQMDGSRIETPPGLVDCVTDQQNFLYVGLKGGGTNVYTIGQLEAAPGSAGSGQPEVSIAVDPQGRFFFDGWGGTAGFAESALISPANGTATNVRPPLSLGSNNSPTSMLVDGSGKFLYVTETGSVYAYQIDGDTSALTASPGPPIPLIFERMTSAADPQGPYIYSLQDDGVHVFEIGPEGALGEILGSPFSTGSSGARGLAVSGTPGQAVTGAIAQLFPPSQDFGSTYVGQTSGTKSLSLTNTGGVALNLTAVGVSGANASDFVAFPNCSLPAFLPTGTTSNSTCSINVSFTPAASGSRQATLTTTTDTAGMQSTTLTGIGISGLSSATIAPASLSFPNTVQGVTSVAQMVTVTNSGAATLHISSVKLGGPNVGDFTMASSCNGPYAANASCAINVTFSPQADGVRSASIAIADDVPGSPQFVPLTGTGSGSPVSTPAVTITPSTLSFAGTLQGATSTAQSIAVTNSGTAALHISSVKIGGANAGDFAMSNGCTAPAYAASATCMVALTFTPSATGMRSGTLTITDDAAGSTQTVQVIGTGTGGGPAVTISAAVIAFGAIALDTTSAQQNITVTSSGTAAVHISSVQLSGANVGDFKLNNGCTATNGYAANTACTLGLTFTPAATGPRAATLTITDDALNSPQTVAVSGNANPLLTVVPAVGGSFSASVAAGQSATFNLQLTAGFNGSVSFVCSGAPQAATCTVPGVTTVTSGAPVPVQITVATTGNSGASRLRDTPSGAPLDVLRLRWLLALLAGVMLCVVAAQPMRRWLEAGAHPRLLWGGVFVPLVALALYTVTGCGGGGAAAQSAPVTQAAVTPPGTSTITIAITGMISAGASLPAIAPTQLTLIVN
jgi:hypothetical protein